MDWAKQMEEMFKTMTQAQKTMWDNWVDTVKGAAKPQTLSSWEQAVQSWENSVKNMLESQALWMRMWARSAAATMPSSESATGTELIEKMTKMWGEAQEQLWSNWFALVKRLDPARMEENWNTDMEKSMQAWQENVHKMMQTQAEWLRSWASMTKNK